MPQNIPTDPSPTSGARRPALLRLAVSLALGAAVFALAAFAGLGHLLFGDDAPVVAACAGWSAAAFCYVAMGALTLWPLNGEQTREWARREDPSAASAHLIITAAALAALGAVLALMAHAQGAQKESALPLALLAVTTVAASWFVIHTVYSLRYAEAYFDALEDASEDDPVPIDFQGAKTPQYSDFAYFSFNLGLTFQVSDTTVGRSSLRRLILVHCLLSYLYATAITASVVNLVVGLA